MTLSLRKKLCSISGFKKYLIAILTSCITLGLTYQFTTLSHTTILSEHNDVFNLIDRILKGFLLSAEDTEHLALKMVGTSLCLLMTCTYLRLHIALSIASCFTHTLLSYLVLHLIYTADTHDPSLFSLLSFLLLYFSIVILQGALYVTWFIIYGTIYLIQKKRARSKLTSTQANTIQETSAQ